MTEEVKNPRIKCYKCMRPSCTCICKHTRPIETNTRFVILMHPKEYKKEKNGTGHMTNLQLENSEIIVGVDFTNNNRVNKILDQGESSSFLLYPGKDNFNLSIRKSSETNTFLGSKPTIFLLDGTWPCARKMLKFSTNLQALPRVSFDNTITSKFVIKQQPDSLCLSTIESIYTVLNLLNTANIEDCETTDFLLPFEKMIEFQLKSILNPDNKHYRSNANRTLVTKNMYKTNPGRAIIYENYND